MNSSVSKANNFWQSDWGVLLKVFALSASLSIAIKFIGPSLQVPATLPVVWGMVLLPTIIVGTLLLLRLQNKD